MPLWPSNKPATVRRIQGVVREIEAIKDDDERAHGLEDALIKHVLQAIASNNITQSPRELATAVLATTQIDFCRWSA